MNIDNQKDSALYNTLIKLKSGMTFCLMNLGNRGDGLIHMGGRQILRDLDITFKEIYYPQSAAGDVLLIYGCGAFGRNWDHMSDFTLHYLDKFSAFIILPSTFDLASKKVRRFVDGLDNRYVVFCRDRVSYESIRNARPEFRALHLNHDLAFYAPLTPWQKRKAQGTVGIFRDDIERCHYRPTFDIEGQDICQGREFESEIMLNYLSQYSEIHTDRCHAAISGARLGKRVFLYPGNYFKNKAVFEYSLSSYSNVTFADYETPMWKRAYITLYSKIQTRLAREKARLSKWQK